MPDSRILTDDDHDCSPCNHSLSLPPPSPPPPPPEYCKISFVFRVQIKNLGKITSGDSEPRVVKIVTSSLEQVELHWRTSCKHMNRLLEKNEISGSYKKNKKEIDRRLVSELMKLDFDGCAMTNVVVEIDMALDQLDSLSLSDDIKDERCAICLESLFVDSHLALPCCHLYHNNCIMEWLCRKQECPLCRRPPCKD
ncbi:E3 ubiquitin-protein ligase RING1-like [Herrania umbratica]|uniref:E3 ubiquitin-protein ligase RING1-like n=1 Tax=Herrania umbratica TaxID=108875 RepID=A0A6J1B7T2_9ROSI|nr:E3 ubiquitin-protein ligase RING1-like [Herrania umbratica]